MLMNPGFINCVSRRFGGCGWSKSVGFFFFGSPKWGVSENGGFSTQTTHFNRVFHYFHHPFLGYPYFWKQPKSFQVKFWITSLAGREFSRDVKFFWSQFFLNDPK